MKGVMGMFWGMGKNFDSLRVSFLQIKKLLAKNIQKLRQTYLFTPTE